MAKSKWDYNLIQHGNQCQLSFQGPTNIGPVPMTRAQALALAAQIQGAYGVTGQSLAPGGARQGQGQGRGQGQGQGRGRGSRGQSSASRSGSRTSSSSTAT